MKKVEVPKWLERLPLAPEFHPTETEFADPIAYISKIEQEASAFGICKIIPPLPKPSRKYVLHNLNKSLSKCPELGTDVNLASSPKKESGDQENCDRTVHKDGCRAVFTTRHQELGCEKGKKAKGGFGETVVGAQKQVWQSGEVYTLEQFEIKSKNFAKSYLGMVKDVNPLVIEAMFWKAASEKPIYVEYANDVPGSGFGEPEGLLPYFHKCRRRKRRKRNSFDRNSLQNHGSESSQLDRLNSYSNNKDSDGQSSSMVCTETPNRLSPVQLDCSNSLPKDFPGSGDKEGTAAWKLSNSPWNLQVIARSPGSLTRFMPDDIPGVTSPMVYIGMLFSWFAWHVEDHELHSLNYLHMGSPKTWYAVPGECAVNFEQAIRQHAYGVNADWLVALSLLGEKTTVMSPEVIVSSGIPCCRLVQNPGEFVVTFPRAYHIGFSHGFNCGEAANFGTPKWLTIAKEAAVRRSAMNYLPMLSHQQLLYQLTMSFISRIPRSLLPGVRSSRLRDRQKEERELSVKKAFIEDIVHENGLLKVLLKRNSSYRAILWDVESLPSSSKESEIHKDAYADSSTLASTDKGSTVNNDYVDDLGDLSMYIGAAAFDLNDDDLAYDFQIESGTLPCVACGVLGFPFMATVQPSCVSSVELLAEPPAVSDATCVEVGVSGGWNVSNASLRPRIFCLEHAIEIEKVLSSKGGANVLIICHSDFQKIKTHASVIAEEIGTPYHYTEIPLVEATPEDLNVLDIAIDRDEKVGHAEDWTSKLNVNLHHCVKVKKSSPAKNIKHLLGLGALFSDAVASPTLIVTNASSPGVKWQSRKVRSTRHLKNLKGKSSANDGEVTNEEQQHLPTKEHVKIIQYTRKKNKVRVAGLVHGVSDGNGPNNGSRNRVDGSVQDSPEQRTNSETVSVIASDEINVEEASTQNGLDGDADAGEIRCKEQIELPDHDQLDNAEVSKCDIPSSEDNHVIGEGDSARASMDDDNDDGENVDLDKFDSNTKPVDNDIDGGKSGDSNKLDSITKSIAKTESGKRKRELRLLQSDDHLDVSGFIRSPCEGLRSRARAPPSTTETENVMKKIKRTTDDFTPKIEKAVMKQKTTKDDDSTPKTGKATMKQNKTKGDTKGTGKKARQKAQGRYECDLDGCTMGFATKAELLLHKANRCPVEGCRKKFNSHKYAIQHQRVHDDDRPLKCPWNGCNMSFKWAWARTEHFRVHTGERPYTCKVEGCGLTFRFVSDFSRHRRKTGHYVVSQKAS